MPYRQPLQKLLDEKRIRGVVIFDPSGNDWWHTGSFPQANDRLLDGYYLIHEWVTFPASAEIAGVKYLTLLNAYPNYWLLTNMQGQGSLILQKAPNDFYFFCYMDDTIDPPEIQKEVKAIASLFAQGV